MDDSMNWLEQLTDNNQLAKIKETNEYTEEFGLSLSEEETKVLLANRKNSLKEQERLELGESVLPKIIYVFCDSAYIYQDNYVDTLVRLQDIFYYFKQESCDELTDDELLTFMKEQFETVCFGDLEYLAGTCLENFAQAVRAGYSGHRQTGGHNEYEKFDEVPRWDKELYLEILRELCWR